MGLGSSEPRREIFYLAMKAKRDKEVDPHFEVTKRENSKTIKLNDEHAVSGYLIRINHGKYEYPKNSGDFVDTIAVHLIDNGAEFKIEASVNTNMARGLMNKIIGITNWEWVTLRVYIKDEYPNLFVGNNDQPMPWKYDYATELKPLIKEVPDPLKPGKYVKVLHDVNALLLNEWIKCERLVQENAKKNPLIMEALKKGLAPATPAAAAIQGPPPSQPNNVTPEDLGFKPDDSDAPTDDVPFTPPPEEEDSLPF